MTVLTLTFDFSAVVSGGTILLKSGNRNYFWTAAKTYYRAGNTKECLSAPNAALYVIVTEGSKFFFKRDHAPYCSISFKRDHAPYCSE